MVSLKVSVIFLLAQLATFLALSSAQGDMCGAAAPDPNKTCISIRLPWNPMPMYFCTDKSKFRYRNQCQNRFQSQCGMDNMRQDTLMIATPWDCCPTVSYPDSCATQKCPPAPYGRTCQTIKPNENQPWECCNSYFCEENVTPETCHFKRLEPNCNMPPKDKMNCVAFRDPFGCCPKFQCDGEGRPGHCPAHVEAMKFEASVNSSAGQAEMHVEAKPAYGMTERVNNGVYAYPSERPFVVAAAADYGAGVRGYSDYGAVNVKTASTHYPMPKYDDANCIGDFNCPGNMKCCSTDMNVYVKDDQLVSKYRNPTYGTCLEPVMYSAPAKKSESE